MAPAPTAGSLLALLLANCSLSPFLVRASKNDERSMHNPLHEKKKPHILFIIADDLGYNDVGYHQNQKSSANPKGLPTTSAAAGIMKTPTIDQLAAESVLLENYYVQPLCSPTRATIMTGRYPCHTGIGPDVDRIDWPIGVPKEEVFFPELLKANNYSTHMVGKWHLGACHEGYFPTARGFDSYVGYLAGGQGYYNQRHDRNATCHEKGGNVIGHCLGQNFQHNYSSIFFANEATRIVQHHANHKNNEDNPLFLYLAFQSVHNPYDEPPIDVDQLYPEIFDRKRRIYAGMIQMMDAAIKQVVDAFQEAGLWDDTVMIFTSDNGGIDVGNNYPLRGTKVIHWEGGIKAAGFVRGTNNPELKPLPQSSICNGLVHSTDWFQTIVEGMAGGSSRTTDIQPKPLDGYNQWDLLAGRIAPKDNPRTTILHNIPVGAKPLPWNDTNDDRFPYTTTMCMHHVDKRINVKCSARGITGGAIRHYQWKLLIGDDFPDPGWGTNTPLHVPQWTPGGQYPNGSQVFPSPPTDTIPEPFQGKYFLFDIENDPTESINLAASMPDKLQEMLDLYNHYATTSARPSLNWRWGFTDPQHGHNPSAKLSQQIGSILRGSRGLAENPKEEETCVGPFLDSEYCAYGHEWECYVMGQDMVGNEIKSSTAATSTKACQESCLEEEECTYWVLNASPSNEDASRSTPSICRLHSAWGELRPCQTCVFGPQKCPE